MKTTVIAGQCSELLCGAEHKDNITTQGERGSALLGNDNKAYARLSEDHTPGKNGRLITERAFSLNKVKQNRSHYFLFREG